MAPSPPRMAAAQVVAAGIPAATAAKLRHGAATIAAKLRCGSAAAHHPGAAAAKSRRRCAAAGSCGEIGPAAGMILGPMV